MFITKLDIDGNVAGPRPREPEMITWSTAPSCDCPSRGRGVVLGVLGQQALIRGSDETVKHVRVGVPGQQAAMGEPEETEERAAA